MLCVFFKQKTAYEMRISDWSSDVCSSDLACRVEVPREFEALAFSHGIEAWLRAVFACNQYVDAQAPWALKKTDPERMRVVLATLFTCIRDLAITISPVIPASPARLLDQLGLPRSEARRVGKECVSTC